MTPIKMSINLELHASYIPPLFVPGFGSPFARPPAFGIHTPVPDTTYNTDEKKDDIFIELKLLSVIAMRAVDVANFFVDISVKSGENDLTKMKLIKLVYFAQALHLAKNKTPLFDEDIQAWDYGPVIPSVFREFSAYQREIIEKTTDTYDSSQFTPEDIDFLIDIEMNYGRFSAIELSRQSHVIGGPWDSVYQKGSNAIIPKEMMAEYYMDKPFKTFTIDSSKIQPVGRRDKDGYLVLPSAMYSPEDDIYDEMYAAECRT